jgi:hypothetical protein
MAATDSGIAERRDARCNLSKHPIGRPIDAEADETLVAIDTPSAWACRPVA